MRHSFPTLYLFNNVFFPQTVIPLTVSDGASKEVLKSCFRDNQHLVLYHPSHRTNKIGTVGRVLMLEHNNDNSMTVLIQGQVRVRILNQEQHLPFPIFQVEDYFDVKDQWVFLNDSIERLHEVLKNWLQRHTTSQKEREKFLKEMDSPAKLINNLCLLVIKDVELKEIFLVNNSLSDRIRLMDAVLRGNAPEIEDTAMSEAIKNFERLEPHDNIRNAI